VQGGGGYVQGRVCVQGGGEYVQGRVCVQVQGRMKRGTTMQACVVAKQQ